MHRRNAMTTMTSAVDRHNRAEKRSFLARDVVNTFENREGRGGCYYGRFSVVVRKVNPVHAAVDTFTIADDWYDRFVALASAGAGAALAGFQV